MNLLNVGEVSKAMSAILSNGVADVNDEVLNQLKTKHPTRPSAVRLPSQEQIMVQRNDGIDDCILDTEMTDSKDGGCPELFINKLSQRPLPKVSPPWLLRQSKY